MANKTASGKFIDMDKLRLKNEDVIAVGNMRTNARGDELGPGGKIIKTRNEKMNENYKLHTMIPKEDVVYDTLSDARMMANTDTTNAGKQITADEIVTKVEDAASKVTNAVKESEPPRQKVNFGEIKVQGADEVPVVSTKKPRGGLAASVSAPEENKTSIPERKVRRI